MPLTPKQTRILDFIKGYAQSNNGTTPTMSEIGKHFEMRSPASVHKVLGLLEDAGKIQRIPNVSRGIRLVTDIEIETVIKDAAVGKGVFTLVERGGKSYIHYNLPQGYLLFAVKVDDVLAVEVNNFLADTLEREHGKATRETLQQFAAGAWQ